MARPRAFIALNNIATPGDSPGRPIATGDIVKESDYPEASIQWWLDSGAIQELQPGDHPDDIAQTLRNQEASPVIEGSDHLDNPSVTLTVDEPGVAAPENAATPEPPPV